MRESVLVALLRSEFLRILVKNYQNSKGPLYEPAKQLKQAILALATQTQLSPSKAKLVLTSLFGPSTETKLAVKRN